MARGPFRQGASCLRAKDEIGKQQRRVGMRCMLRQGQCLRTPDQRLNRYPVDGTAFGFDRICVPAVEREAHQQFARSHELRDEDVALAHLRLERRKPPEKIPAHPPPPPRRSRRTSSRSPWPRAKAGHSILAQQIPPPSWAAPLV